MWETWLSTTMQPADSGILSPSIQVREVAASRVGFKMTTPTLIAQPRFCCSLRTFTPRPSLLPGRVPA